MENKIPKHIAIIMDGNGRWAKAKNMPRSLGHKAGMERVVEIVEYSSNIGVEILTLYAFSTENWKRPEEEVNGLMNLLVIYIRNQLSRLARNRVRINALGDLTRLPKLAREELERALSETKYNDGMILNIAINYGSRGEILKAFKDIYTDIDSGIISIDDVNEDTISQYLYTGGQIDPDLIIRPGEEERISNFLLYQSAYSELYFTDVLWPDFTKAELDEAIKEYNNRNRRYGGL